MRSLKTSDVDLRRRWTAMDWLDKIRVHGTVPLDTELLWDYARRDGAWGGETYTLRNNISNALSSSFDGHELQHTEGVAVSHCAACGMNVLLPEKTDKPIALYCPQCGAALPIPAAWTRPKMLVAGRPTITTTDNTSFPVGLNSWRIGGEMEEYDPVVLLPDYVSPEDNHNPYHDDAVDANTKGLIAAFRGRLGI